MKNLMGLKNVRFCGKPFHEKNEEGPNDKTEKTFQLTKKYRGTAHFFAICCLNEDIHHLYQNLCKTRLILIHSLLQRNSQPGRTFCTFF